MASPKARILDPCRLIVRNPNRGTEANPIVIISEPTLASLGFLGFGFRNHGCSTIRLPDAYLWLVGNGRMVVIAAIIVPHSSISS